MTYQPRTEYLKTQVMTASPETLQLMLWDGAIRFAEQGKECILQKDIEGSYNKLLRSQKIIMEMTTSLRPEVDPALCKNLSALYNFIYRRLVDANLHKDPKAVDEAVDLMRHQRETWVMLMDQLSEQRTGEAQATARENADAIAASEDIAAEPVAARTPAPSRPRGLYADLIAKPVPVASLSVQG